MSGNTNAITTAVSSNQGVDVGAMTGLVGTTRAQPGGPMGTEEFLHLFVEQIRHQDPLNPMQGSEMAAQLAQFSSVEQLITLNSTIAGQQQAQEAMLLTMNNAAALDTVGKTVTAAGDQVVVQSGEPTRVELDVSGKGGTGIIRLRDANGTVLGEKPVSLVGGRQTVDVSDLATGLPAGSYRVETDLTDPAGAPVTAQVRMTGRVDEVEFTAQGAVMLVGPLRIPVSSLLSISE